LHSNELHGLYIPTNMIIHTTDPTKHRPAGEADCRSADLENPIVTGVEFHFRVHERPPLCVLLNEINQVYLLLPEDLF